MADAATTPPPSAPTEEESKQYFQGLLKKFCAEVLEERDIFSSHDDYIVSLVKHFARIFEAADGASSSDTTAQGDNGAAAQAQRHLQALWSAMVAHVIAVGEQAPGGKDPKIFHAELSLLRQYLSLANERVLLETIRPVDEHGRVLYTDENRKEADQEYVEQQIAGAGDIPWYGLRVRDITAAVNMFVGDTSFIATLERELFDHKTISSALVSVKIRRYESLSVFGAEATYRQWADKEWNAPGLQLAARVIAHTLEEDRPEQKPGHEFLDHSLIVWLPLPHHWINAHGLGILKDAFAPPGDKAVQVKPGPLAEKNGILEAVLTRARWDFWKTRFAQIKKAWPNEDYLLMLIGEAQSLMKDLETHCSANVDTKAAKKDTGCCVIL